MVERTEAPQLAISGEVDLQFAEALREAGARAADRVAPGSCLEIDMTGLTFIDSSGLGALVSIRESALAVGCSGVALIGMSAQFTRLFDMTGLTDSFVFEPGN